MSERWVRHWAARRRQSLSMICVSLTSDLRTTSQFDSVNLIEGDVPLAVEHLPRFKLLLSPVVPAFATHFGAAVVPSVSASLTAIETGVLKFAREPPASPTTLNSDSFHTWEISSTVS